jgi:hypothetical protein
MSKSSSVNWLDANQCYLSAALATVRLALESQIARTGGKLEGSKSPDMVEKEVKKAAEAMPAPPAIEILSATFGLSAFERTLLLLCAGMELDTHFAGLCAAAHGDVQRFFPTFSLGLAALPQPHWSAINPSAPLRRWRLIEVGNGPAITLCPLRVDERVLHYLAGVQYFDERLLGVIEPLQVRADELAPSHQALAERIAAAWSQAVKDAPLPIIQLCGEESAGKHQVAAAVSAMVGLRLCVVSAYAIPTNPVEMETVRQLWERESILDPSALLVDCEDLDVGDAMHENAVARWLEAVGGAAFVTSRERRRMKQRQLITFEVRKPTVGEQRRIWQIAIGKAAENLNGRVDTLVTQFNLSAPAIRAVCAEAIGRRSLAEFQEVGGTDLGDMVWEACCAQSRPRLGDLAQRIEPVAKWNDLVLPEAQYLTLHDIALHIRQRLKVYETWGFAHKSARGLGISALFTGPSGTGKTMAAEVLANELHLDLYRIDLSQVVSKYIGETEKNLRRVFDAAEDGGAILLFDEADALFGKRSEIKDSHDRYANIEVSYLLQRMEAYRGLAMLTTNMKDALDTAFMRRIRFVVQFPFPDVSQRAEIWRRVFPAETPTEALDVVRLAHLNVAGGNIHNIAMHAAFLAADAGGAVHMDHLLRAARAEYAKLERPLTEAEIGEWA